MTSFRPTSVGITNPDIRTFHNYFIDEQYWEYNTKIIIIKIDI